MQKLPTNIQQRLESEKNIWFGSVRPDGRPHLVPVWFVWNASRLYVCIEPESVKSRNVQQNPHVVLALEDGSSPVICEGTAALAPNPWPASVIAAFRQKYGWDIGTDTQYTQLIEVTPGKWLVW